MTRPVLVWVVVAATLLATAACAGERDTGSVPVTTLTTTAAAAVATTVPSTTVPSTTVPSTTLPTTTRTPSTTLPAFPEDRPAWPLDFPDPFVLATEGRFFAFGTTSGRLQVQRLDAPDLTEWVGPADALPVLPSWADPYSAWAPAVLHTAEGYVLYYTAQVAGTDRHCIAVATADDPGGPFAAVGGEPLVCPHEAGGAIDPSPFVDRDGGIHLLWKNDGITLRRDSAIWSQPLDATGTATAGEAVVLITTDQAWEFPHVEAPSMAVIDGVHWLAYSGNWWNQPAYGVGLARCDSPEGPCVKPFDAPVLRSRPGAEGPGGAEFFRDGTGRLLVAYHAWLGEVGYPGARALWVDGVVIAGGVPEFGGSPG